MAPKFGTSGLRGLVSELTPARVRRWTGAFLASGPTGGAVLIGRDLRPSSPAIAAEVIAAVTGAGATAIDCGALPTPALALHAAQQGCAAIMVTGSHIPADRNGLKFYRPEGEITKADEATMSAAYDSRGAPDAPGGAHRTDDGAAAYCARYVAAYGLALTGLRIGVYQHSSVARDLLVSLLERLGAEPVPLGRSETFVPVDTEAVPTQTRDRIAHWCDRHALDALVSTDGDADRPLVADAAGRIVPGDVLGALTARAIGATALCVPVSSNTLLDAMPDFAQVIRTGIGSPFVIAAMQAVHDQRPEARVVGFEPNGGFLLGFTATGPAGTLPPLMTRDCMLPIVAPLAEARARGVALADLVAALPARFTAADRIAHVAPGAAPALIAHLAKDAGARAAFFVTGAPERSCDLTDGLRVRFANGEIVHLRASGNAPEARCYAEAATPARAEALMRWHLDRMARRLRPDRTP